MSDNQFWVATWTIAATALVLVLFLFLNYNLDSNKVVAEMVLGGVNPIEANCAIYDSMGNNPTCVAAITKK